MPFHTDAVQAAAQLPVDFAASGVDAMTVTAHKLGGPVGVGALILGRAVAPVPVLHGGGQERDIRSGTLDAPADQGLRGRGGGLRAAAARAEAVRIAALARRPDPAGAARGARRRAERAAARARTGCRATRTSPSPAARATRCCCCSTPAASPAPPARPAPPGWPSRATCCSRWAPTSRARAARCASPSATPPPRPTWTPSARDRRGGHPRPPRRRRHRPLDRRSRRARPPCRSGASGNCGFVRAEPIRGRASAFRATSGALGGLL